MKHLTGISLIVANAAAFLYGQLSVKWPAGGHDWTLLVLLLLASGGAGTALYRTPMPIAPIPSSHEN